MQIAVIGTGRWGTFQAWHFSEILGHDVTLVGRDEQDSTYRQLVDGGRNQYQELPDSIKITTDHVSAIKQADYVVIAIYSQALRSYLSGLPEGLLDGKKLILCMKGIENKTGKRLTQIVNEVAPKAIPGILVGPGHVQEMIKGVPTCQVVDSNDPAYTKELQDLINSNLIRVYEGNDLIGNEIGAALKNVIGISAGYLDGLELYQLKGALMARGCYEVGKIMKSLGGRFISVYGLAHLGDYEATLFSPHSKNRTYGEYLAKGKEIDWTAEGVETCRAIYNLIDNPEKDAPIINSVYKVLFEGLDYQSMIKSIFQRETKMEFMEDVLDSEL